MLIDMRQDKSGQHKEERNAMNEGMWNAAKPEGRLEGVHVIGNDHHRREKTKTSQSFEIFGTDGLVRTIHMTRSTMASQTTTRSFRAGKFLAEALWRLG